ILLIVRDDGVGLPPHFDFNRTATLGLQLVQGLVQQIDGTIAVHPRAGGAQFEVILPGKRGAIATAAHPDR
ncbi:MAG: hypothetical protein QOH21_2365, partial [Acidobacteriota bacterium]|nr:hypothetical protein [Acidobacteriota bacterium]